MNEAVNSFAEWFLAHRLAVWIVLAGALCNASCALLGCYLVLRRMSLLGDAISHSILPGIVISFLFFGKATLATLVGAMIMGVITAWLTQSLTLMRRVPEDTSMGIVYTSLFALGVFLLTCVARNVDLDPSCVLYGAIELVPLGTKGFQVPAEIISLGLCLVATLAFVVLFWKELKIVSFDPALATAIGLQAGVIHYLLMGMVAVVTVATFEAVGSVLVVAMLIVPAATAHLLTDRLDRMLVWAALLGVSCALLGYLGAAYLGDTTAAGMMAVAAGLQFALAVVFAPRHGLLGKALNNFSLSLRIVSEDLAAMLYRAEELTRRWPSDQQLTWPECARALGGGPAGWLAVLALWRKRQIQLGPARAIQLTPEGRQNAQSLVRAHRLWEAFLVEYFQLPLDHLHAPAERVEHYIGPQLQESLEATLHAPATDPHGRDIPPSTIQTTMPPAQGSDCA